MRGTAAWGALPQLMGPRGHRAAATPRAGPWLEPLLRRWPPRSPALSAPPDESFGQEVAPWRTRNPRGSSSS
jgi:hypothetical protein